MDIITDGNDLSRYILKYHVNYDHNKIRVYSSVATELFGRLSKYIQDKFILIYWVIGQVVPMKSGFTPNLALFVAMIS